MTVGSVSSYSKPRSSKGALNLHHNGQRESHRLRRLEHLWCIECAVIALTQADHAVCMLKSS